MDPHTLRVIDIATERMHQKIQFEAEAQQCPIFPCEVGKQWLTLAHVTNISNAKDIQIVVLLLLFLVIDLCSLFLLLLHFLIFLFTIVTFSLLRLFRGDLFCLFLPSGLLLMPLLQLLLPCTKLLSEPLRRLDIFDTSCQFSVKYPVLEVFSTFCFFCTIRTGCRQSPHPS